jgi:hypothetical protein
MGARHTPDNNHGQHFSAVRNHAISTCTGVPQPNEGMLHETVSAHSMQAP